MKRGIQSILPAPPVRWIIGNDLEAVADIDRASFDAAVNWNAGQYKAYLRQRNVVGWVADCSRLQHTLAGGIGGFITYEMQDGLYMITSIAVHPAVRHQGVGRAMIAKLVEKLRDSDRRASIMAATREDNLPAHLFFRGVGFRCTHTERRYYVDGADAYWFRLRKSDIGEYANSCSEFYAA